MENTSETEQHTVCNDDENVYTARILYLPEMANQIQWLLSGVRRKTQGEEHPTLLIAPSGKVHSHNTGTTAIL